MNRLAQLLELFEGKMRNARLWWDQTKSPAQSTRLFWSPLTNLTPPPSPPPSPAELPTCPKSTLLLACEQQTDRKYVCYAQASIFVTFQNKCNGYPTKEPSGDGIEQKRFSIKGKAHSVFFRPTQDETFHVRQTRAERAKSYSCILSFYMSHNIHRRNEL